MKDFFWQFFVIMVVTASGAFGQTRTGLPLDLDYFMSRPQAVAHLHLLTDYQIPSGDPNTLAYVIPDPTTDTKNGLFLKFNGKGLIEIASMKTGLTKVLFSKYMTGLLAIATQWKAVGVETITEDSEHNFYLYRDSRSYITISGDLFERADDHGFNVTIAFGERDTHDSTRR